MFVRVTLKDGEQAVSEFSKMRGIGTYASEVMSGRKAFALWRPVAQTHPISGAPCLVRSRVMVNGTEVRNMEVVIPTTEEHNFDPRNFTPLPNIQRGPYGLWTVPENEDRPEGVPVGAQFPVYRDSVTLRRYVVLRVAENGNEERRHWLDGEPSPVRAAAFPSDSDEAGDYDTDDE